MSWQEELEKFNRKSLGIFIGFFDFDGNKLFSGDLVSVEIQNKKEIGRILWNEEKKAFSLFSSFISGNPLNSISYRKILFDFDENFNSSSVLKLKERIQETFSGSDFK